jgi:y4mF family transcriptional regulator
MGSKSSRSAGSPRRSFEWATALAAEVRRQRKELRLTQIELAALARCGPDFLYDVENAKPTLRLDKVVSVLEVLGLRLLLEPGTGGLVVKVHGTAAATLPAPIVRMTGRVGPSR